MSTKGSFLGWLATGLIVATAPFVAHAQLDDAGMLPGTGVDSGANPVLDAAPPPIAADGGAPETSFGPDAVPGPSLPTGDATPARDLVMDTPQGCTCSTPRPSRTAPLSLVALAALVLFRRKK